jgi:murein DD-endopeptidase MepM/ murein hydrolase activator NlpD
MHPKRRFSLFSWIKAGFNRLFCRRSIIVIADHKTQHMPVSVLSQLGMMLAFTGLVVWVSYSTGSYMAAQRVLLEKDRTIASATEENKRVEAEFILLRRDLTTLANQSNNGKMASDAQLIVEQYTNAEGAPQLHAVTNAPDYNAVFARIEFLETRMQSLQTTHDTMVHEIEAATGGKIKEIEKVISLTGQNIDQLKRKQSASKKRSRFWPQGGPYEPIKTPILRNTEPELYMNLKHLMQLDGIMEHLPLAQPIAKGTRRTSRFGARKDPFTHKLAFHGGMDFAGRHGAKVTAAGDGRVVHAGRKHAYGNVVDIDHGLGFITRYAHLRSVSVKRGDIVNAGQLIGKQGSTGRSTGSHLHYEVRHDGRAINPKPFIRAGEYVRSLK